MVIVVDWSTFGFTILTSSVVGAVVSSVFSEWLKRNDYKRDYYKKIIDKRIATYERLATVITNVGLKATYFITNEEKEIYVCFESLSNLQKINEDLVMALSDVHWYSPRTYKKLRDINCIFAGVLDRAYKDRLKGKQWNDNDFREAGLGEHYKVKEALLEINDLSIKDRMKIDRVKEFFKEQKEELKK